MTAERSQPLSPFSPQQKNAFFTWLSPRELLKLSYPYQKNSQHIPRALDERALALQAFFSRHDSELDIQIQILFLQSGTSSKLWDYAVKCSGFTAGLQRALYSEYSSTIHSYQILKIWSGDKTPTPPKATENEAVLGPTEMTPPTSISYETLYANLHTIYAHQEVELLVAAIQEASNNIIPFLHSYDAFYYYFEPLRIFLYSVQPELFEASLLAWKKLIPKIPNFYAEFLVEIILLKLEDPDAWIHLNALQTLTLLIPKIDNYDILQFLVDPILKTSKHKDDWLDLAALQALTALVGKLNNPKVLQSLIPLIFTKMEHESPALRKTVLQSVLVLIPQLADDTAAESLVTPIFKALEDEDESVCEIALQAIELLIAKPNKLDVQSFFAPLATQLEKHPDPEIREAVSKTISLLLPQLNLKIFLLKLRIYFASPDAFLRQQAFTWFSRIVVFALFAPYCHLDSYLHDLPSSLERLSAQQMIIMKQKIELHPHTQSEKLKSYPSLLFTKMQAGTLEKYVHHQELDTTCDIQTCAKI